MSERKIRQQNYKGYLDLQMKVQNKKLELENNNVSKSRQIFNRRYAELDNLHKELKLKEESFKYKLANVYEQQIAEKKDQFPTSCRTEENNFSSTMVVNQSRYYKVILS